MTNLLSRFPTTEPVFLELYFHLRDLLNTETNLNITLTILDTIAKANAWRFIDLLTSITTFRQAKNVPRRSNAECFVFLTTQLS